MAGILQSIISGLIVGSIYAAMAMGLTLIYGGLRLLNLAQGALFMIGGYAGWLVSGQVGLPPLIGMLAAFAIVAIFGMAIQLLVIRRLIRMPGWEINTIVATLGLGILLENVALAIFGPQNKNQPLLVNGDVRLPYGITVTNMAIASAAITIVLLAAMGLFLRQSRHGMAIRAISQHMTAARLMGINVERTYLLIMAISAGLAGLAGVMLSAFYYVYPSVGETYLLKGLIITIFGGLGSVKGTIYAAYIIGMVEELVSYIWGASWSLPVLFLLIIAVLVVRPAGLFGVPEEARL
ncbi:MAG TPA: branched-chain amino acid ABC transporter permease [Chloroflexota bacterium]|nr:branched-chain amino acid ABC transporter permease [Chloroflexota bacterium]